MMTDRESRYLDPEPIVAERFVRLERAAGELLETHRDIVLAQAEAVLPLEAAARGLGRPGLHALNLNTKPYGAAFGRWLRESGASVVGLDTEAHRAIAPEAVARALSKDPAISLVSFVHAEAASGVRNDARAIAAIAREHGALTVIDLVASFGAEEVRLDDWGVDLAVIGPQKALAGPAGISITAVSERAWAAMSANPGAPRDSILSLLDWKQRWLETDKSAIPATPSPLEIIALEAALARVAAEGLFAVRRRHRAATAAARAGARALGLSLFASDSEAAFVATTLSLPGGLDARALVARAQDARPVALSVGFGELAPSVVRVDHTGQRATLSIVLEVLQALGAALSSFGALLGSTTDALAEAKRAFASAQQDTTFS
jgi:aspartate aminotransferase-like enzyme